MRAIAIHRVPTLAKASSETSRVLCERVPNIATQKRGRLQGLHKYARQHPWPYMAHQGELSLRRMRRTRCIKTYLLDAEIDLVLAVDRSRGRKASFRYRSDADQIVRTPSAFRRKGPAELEFHIL